jgi:hypothetical protein
MPTGIEDEAKKFMTRLIHLREGLALTLELPQNALQLIHSRNLQIDSTDPSEALTDAWFKGTSLEGRFWFYLNTKESNQATLKGELVLVDPDLPEINCELAFIQQTNNRVRGPVLIIAQKDLERFKSFYPDLMKTFLRWVYHKKSFQEAEFELLFPGSRSILTTLFDSLNSNKSSEPPYWIEPPAGPDRPERLVVSIPRLLDTSFSSNHQGILSVFLPLLIYSSKDLVAVRHFNDLLSAAAVLFGAGGVAWIATHVMSRFAGTRFSNRLLRSA